MKASYSGAGIKVLSLNFSFLNFTVYSIIIAFLMFLLEKLVIELANY
jgi:hypothetical protein